MKKIIVLILLFVLATNSIYAEGNVFHRFENEGIKIEPRFSNIYSFHAYFDITSNGKAEIVAALDGHDGSDSKIEARLQQFKNGSWTTIKTFTSESSTSDCSMNLSYYVMSGYTYRTIFYAYVYSGPIILDYASYTSQPVSY